MNWNQPSIRYILRAFCLFLVFGALFMVFKTVEEIKLLNYVGKSASPIATINVSGTADVYATPDVAMVSFSISGEAKTVAGAESSVTNRMNDILAFIKKSGVDEKDVKTTNYSIFPNYEYEKTSICTVDYCPPTENKIFVGYTVAHSAEIKIRKTADAGAILSGLAEHKVTTISGLTFSVDNDEALKADARSQAIADAKQKAVILAKQLGVSLGDIISFSESGNYPVYSKYDLGMGGGGGGVAVPSVEVPAGQNKISSNVILTYEIR